MRLPAAVLVSLLALGAAAQPRLPVPRELLLGPAERASPALSPDGLRLAYLAPDARGVVQAWVRTLGRDDDAPLTTEGRPGVRGLAWASDGAALLLLAAPDGGEAAHLLQLDLASRRVRDLTPWRGVGARLLATSARVPDQVLVELDFAERMPPDVHRVNVRTGAVELDTPNPGDVEGWVVDAALRVRGARAVTREGGTELRVREARPGAPFRPLVAASPEERLELVDFTDDGRSAVVATTLSADTDRVVEKSLQTGAERLLGRSEKSDLVAWLGHPTRHQVRALGFEVAGRLAWTAIDWRVKDDLEGLARTLGADFSVVSMDAADARWVVEVRPEGAAPRYVLWDRRTRKAEALFEARPRLGAFALAPRRPVTFTARDGTALAGFLTRPVAEGPGPLVLLVHGGPWSRDAAGFDPQAALLADRGLAVLQVNFRGSSGAGKRLANLGTRQWGLAVEDDLVDAVAWAVREGVADPARVAVVGAGAGGAAALLGLAAVPGVFACGVDVFGPPSVGAWLEASPPWLRPRLARRLGDPAEPADASLLARSSLRTALERVQVPLLLVRDGALEPEAESLAAAAEARGATVVRYPDERGAVTHLENQLDLAARIEAFLAKCLAAPAKRVQ